MPMPNTEQVTTVLTLDDKFASLAAQAFERFQADAESVAGREGSARDGEK